MTVEFEISATLQANPKQIFSAWLDSTQHSEMTGGAAQVSDQVGGQFTAWDGYISGTNMKLETGKRIVQAWRTVEFADNEPDSKLVIIFETSGEGCRVILRHSELPPHGTQYEQGWIDNYFEPMKHYFQSQ